MIIHLFAIETIWNTFLGRRSQILTTYDHSVTDTADPFPSPLKIQPLGWQVKGTGLSFSFLLSHWTWE